MINGSFVSVLVEYSHCITLSHALNKNSFPKRISIVGIAS